MRLLLPLLFLSVLSLPALAQAVAPGQVHYQGVLRDASDRPVDGDLRMVFRFHSAATGGAEILVDEHPAVRCASGLFSAALGSGTVRDGSGPGTYADLAAVFRDHPEVWLELEIAGETLSPRTRLVSAAYALNASSLGGRRPEEYVLAEGNQVVEGVKEFTDGLHARQVNGITASTAFAGVTDCVAAAGAGGTCRITPEEDDTVTFAESNPDRVQDVLNMDMRGGRFRLLTTRDYPSDLASAGPESAPFVLQPRWNDAVRGGWDCHRDGYCAVGYQPTNYWYTGSCNLNGTRCAGLPIFQVRAPQTPETPDRPIFSVGADGVSIYQREDNRQQVSLAIHYPSDAAYGKGGMPMYAFTNGGFFADGDMTLAPPQAWPSPFNPGVTWRPHFLSISNDVGALYDDGDPNYAVYVESNTETPSPTAITGFLQMHDRQHGLAAHCVTHPCGPMRFRFLSDGSQTVSGRWFDTTAAAFPEGRAALHLHGVFRSAETGAAPAFDALRVATAYQAAADGVRGEVTGVRSQPALEGAAAGNVLSTLAGGWFRPRLGGTGSTAIGTLAAVRAGLDLGGSGWSATQAAGVQVDAPSGPAAGSVDRAYGILVADQRGLGSVSGAALRIEPQGGGRPTRGNLELGGGGFADGHLVVGPVHVWTDGTGHLRAATAPPAGPEDGPQLLLSGEAGDGSALAGVDAEALGGLPPESYLRRDAPDTFAGSALTIAAGSALEVAGDARFSGLLHVAASGPDRDQAIAFLDGGVPGAERILWSDVAARFETSDDLTVDGDLAATGRKLFVQNHPDDPTREIAYTALEGDEAATFTRGSARLRGGEARVALGETFAWVTSPETGLTAHLTARGPDAGLYVESLTSSELVVRASPGTDPHAAFDFLVIGLRLGYEDASPVRPRTIDARIPAPGTYERFYAAHPSLRAGSPAARHRAMEAAAGRAPGPEGEAGDLRARIGADDPGEPGRPAAGLAPGRPEDPQPPAGADAERLLPVAETVTPGDVLVADLTAPERLARGRQAEDPGVVGVVSGPPGSAYDRGLAPVAVSGIVPCKVDAAYGEIRRGDLLAASPTTGHAMRAATGAPGTVVAKALEPWVQGTGTIRVLVAPR